MERDFEKARQSLTDEKERHKQIVMYLLQERRQLLVRLMEERQKGLKAQQQQQPPAETPETEDAAVSKKSNGDRTTEDLLKELDSVRKQLDEERKETSSLKEVVKTQEEDLNLIRQMILAKSRQAASQQPSPTTGTVKTPGQSKPVKNENTNGGGTPTTGHVVNATTPTSPSAAPDGRYQILSRPNTSVATAQQQPVQRPIQHQHYAATDVGSSSPVVASSPQQQQPIRLLTNPAYQQQQQHPYQTGVSVTRTAAPTPPRGRPVPPPAPHHSMVTTRGSPSMSDRVDSSTGK